MRERRTGNWNEAPLIHLDPVWLKRAVIVDLVRGACVSGLYLIDGAVKWRRYGLGNVG